MSIADSISKDAKSADPGVKELAEEEEDKEGLRTKRLANDITEDDKNERKHYTSLIFTLVAMWLIMVLVVFVATGKGFLKYSDSVIITLLATTTVNVIGLFVIVANYLYHTK